VAAAVACAQAPAAKPRPAGPPTVRYANIGGYRLAYECAGYGTPAVILEAGYTASGIGTCGPVIVPALARRTRVCTYDRAGDGLSDARPASVRPLTAATQAEELRTLLHVIHARPPCVLPSATIPVTYVMLNDALTKLIAGTSQPDSDSDGFAVQDGKTPPPPKS
jgi:hypothetical protein